MLSHIGIKIANGEFYSIIEENSTGKKRLVLTTVHDKQQSVQIDLYKSQTSTMLDAVYIGSLVVEKIKPRPRGEPSIELILASDDSGKITADAVDLDTSIKGEHHSLSVSLTSFEESALDTDIPDFELEHNEDPPLGLLKKASVQQTVEKRPFPWLAVAGAVLILAAIGLAVWYFLLRSDSSAARPSVAPPVVQTQPPAPAVQPAAPPPPVVQPPVIQAPASPPPAAPAVSRERRNPPVASFNIPAIIPREGVAYRIRWGDTLWDISEAFYRTPWLYPRIARFNNIRNPDRIISGTIIRVPPRN